MAASTFIPLSSKSKEIFVTYYNSIQDMGNDYRNNLRYRLEQMDLAYAREVDRTKEQLRAKASNRAGDTDRFQNITVPVVLPQVETAVQYQTSVFLTNVPLFPVVAAPEYEDAAMQLSTIIDNNATTGGWARELMLHFRDGFKYNFAPIEVSWADKVTFSVETDLEKNPKYGIPKKVIWSGNTLKRLDPYNTFVDPRVAPTEVYSKGEYAGYTEFMTRMQLKTLIEELPEKILSSIVPAFNSSSNTLINSNASAKNFYVPTINPDVNLIQEMRDGTNWMSWAGLSDTRKNDIEYKDTYEVTTLYCRILPAEFNLRVPESNTPQIYKLIIVNHEHIIYCERQTNAHNMLPILIGQPMEDGLRYQTKSLADNVSSFQEVASAYMNSIMHSRRRAVTDRLLYDPSRVAKEHINSDNPSAKIPVRPAAYGKQVSDAVYQFPYREDQAQISMQQIQQLLALSNHISGQNPVSQGQFVKGNKLQDEFKTIMQNANGRDQTQSILLEYQVFIPMKHIIKLNTLQYQAGTTLYNENKQTNVQIDPIKLRKAVLNFKIADGLIPSTKLIDSESLAVALQTLGSAPQIAAAYNMGPLFSYLMKTKGAHIAEFEKSPEQQAYEQALAQWQQVAMTAAEKGVDISKSMPMPKPQDYGYDPRSMNPSVKNPEQDTTPTPVPGDQ